MALDGAFIHCLRRELRQRLEQSRIDKVFQPSRDELILQMRGANGTEKLYFSARAASPRVHLMAQTPENPATPPMFCMLLRKRLTGGRLADIRQNGWERALYFDFDCLNELGDPVRLTLACEMMGRHSNVILIGPNGHIVDALHRVDFTMSSVRPVLPGLPYELPPAEADRLDLSAVSAEAFCEAVLRLEELPLDKALLQTAHGLSPLVCREIAFRVLRGGDATVAELSEAQRERLLFFVRTLRETVLEQGAVPYLLAEQGNPREFSFTPILQYGLSAVGSEMPTFSALLEHYYAEKDARTRQQQNAKDILRVLGAAADRVARKLARQQQEWEQGQQRDQKRLFADLLMAQAHTVPKGAASVQLVNYYDENCASITVPLDPSLSAAANAQKYYKEYRKAQTACTVLEQQMQLGRQEARYLDSVFDALSRAQTMRELAAIREELTAGGYLRAVKGRQKPPPAPAPMAFVSSDGYEIRVGRNNLQNDQLTLKTARGSDWWFHTKNLPGAHVIVFADGTTPPDSTLEQAAILAATFSRAGESSASVEVDFAQVRHVRKPAGAKPGMVIYDHNRTALVAPDKALAHKLAKEQ